MINIKPSCRPFKPTLKLISILPTDPDYCLFYIFQFFSTFVNLLICCNILSTFVNIISKFNNLLVCYNLLGTFVHLITFCNRFSCQWFFLWQWRRDHCLFLSLKLVPLSTDDMMDLLLNFSRKLVDNRHRPIT